MTDVLSQRVADLAGLSLVQREALRAVARASANEAEEQLQVMLGRWSEPMLRRYVAEVLIGGEKAYLQLVVRESRSDALTDYVDHVLDGRLGHDEWVERHLPRFGSGAGR